MQLKRNEDETDSEYQRRLLNEIKSLDRQLEAKNETMWNEAVAFKDIMKGLEYKISNQKDYINKQTTKINKLEQELSKERSHIKTCHIAMENHHKEMELKDSFVKHHQKSVEIAMADRRDIDSKKHKLQLDFKRLEEERDYWKESAKDWSTKAIEAGLKNIGRGSNETESSETTQVDTKKENT